MYLISSQECIEQKSFRLGQPIRSSSPASPPKKAARPDIFCRGVLPVIFTRHINRFALG
jgi:hypothetical protein